MLQTHNTKTRGEHLIFVKNVPAYMAVDAIPDLYAQYKPLRFKNVYPNGDITTLVVAFQAYDKAVQAQQDTDGMRLDNVVLRVEMYSKYRSLRFLREGRATHQQLRVVHENIKDKTEGRSAPFAEEEYLTPRTYVHQENLGATTWAQIVRHDCKPSMKTPPAPVAAIRSQPQVSLEKPAMCTSETITDVTYFSIAFEPAADAMCSRTVGSEGTLVGSSNTSSTEFAGSLGDFEDDCEMKERPVTTEEKTVAYSAIFAASEPTDTDERIRQRHYWDCAFCQMRIQFSS
jgi:hypothetical protein